MVVKLEGCVNGSDVIFTRKSGDVWETSIPANLSGMYVVELTAYDDAGNKSFLAKYILTIDVDALTVSLELIDYQSAIVRDDYESTAFVSIYYAKLCVNDYRSEVEVC